MQRAMRTWLLTGHCLLLVGLLVFMERCVELGGRPWG